jgi:hypothetical protein
MPARRGRMKLFEKSPHRVTRPSGRDGWSLIRVLLLASGPAAIAWLVVAVVVDAIKGCAFRSRPHVGEEVFKCAPTGAELDATASVILVRRVFLVCTSALHCAPRGIFRRLKAAVVGIPVNGDGFQMQASA